MKIALSPSTVRHYPNQAFPGEPFKRIEAALNERFSFQVVLRSDTARRIEVGAEGPSGWEIRVRRVGLVPQEHHNTPVMDDPLEMDGLGHVPGFVPDPLLEQQEMLLPEKELHSFWISVSPAAGAQAGLYDIGVTVATLEDGAKPAVRKLRAKVKLYNVTIPPRRDFRITHWFYNDQLIDWYKCDLFDKRFWEILPRYVRNVVEHGQDVLYVPMFTPSLDGVKRPSQLLRVTDKGGGRYGFGWGDVKRYIDVARAQGITHFEWTHLFTQWGVRNAIRIYEGQGRDERLLWPPETPATDEVYRNFLAQFLPSFKRFLNKEGLMENSFFHLSDEPHGEEALANYGAARQMLRELAPWMECMDAISQIEFAEVVDLPIPSISTALSFHQAGIASWCYYCCGPRDEYLNRLLDTPLAKIAMHGFLFYRWGFGGFLHWGYNYWCRRQQRELIDPFRTSDGDAWPGWAYGDTFVVYPGEEGPIDSMRWEVFAESLQDMALLQAAEIGSKDKLLEELQDFNRFPKEAEWRRACKRKLYQRLEKRAAGVGK